MIAALIAAQSQIAEHDAFVRMASQLPPDVREGVLARRRARQQAAAEYLRAAEAEKAAASPSNHDTAWLLAAFLFGLSLG